jgi:hypothetical protein
MRIQIESTDGVTIVNGVPCRVWNGVTEGGARCTVLVHRLAVAPDQDAADFDRELQQTDVPPEALRNLSLREVLP